MGEWRCNGAWRAVLAVVLAGAWMRVQARCELPQIEFADEEGSTSSLSEDVPYCIRVSCTTKEVEIDICRHMDPLEIVALTDEALDTYGLEIAARFSAYVAGFRVQVHGLRDRSRLCAPECCTETALRLLSMVAGVEDLGVEVLEVFDVYTEESLGLIAQGKELFQALAAQRPMKVEKLCASYVSSYFFCGVCHIVAVAPVCGSSVAVSYVHHISFATHPPWFPWNVATLTFKDVNNLDLGAVVMPYDGWDAAEGGARAWGRGVLVGRRLAILGRTGYLKSRHTVLLFAVRSVSVEIHAAFIILTVAPQPSVAELAVELRAVIACLAALDTALVWAALVVGKTYGLDYNLSESKKAEFAAGFASGAEEQMESPVPMWTWGMVVEIREEENVFPFMHVHVGVPGGETDMENMVPWVVRVEREMLQSESKIRHAVEKLSVYASNPYAAQAAGVLQSLLPGGENSALLAGVPEPWPEKMTLLPCGCFSENAWNTAWHGAEIEAGEEHGYMHTACPPFIDMWWDPSRAHVALGVTHMVYWRAPLPRKEARSAWLCLEAVTCSADAGCVSVEIPSAHALFGSPSPEVYLRQVRERVVPAIKAAARNARRLFFRKVAFKVGAGISDVVYRYLCARVLQTLAESGVSAGHLEVVHAHTPPCTAEPTPYQRVLLGRAKRKSPRLRAAKLTLAVSSLKEVGWVARAVAVGTARQKGVLSVTLQKHVEVRVRADGTGVAEVRAPRVEAVLAECKWRLGAVCLTCPHTAVFQGAEPFLDAPLFFCSVPRVAVGGVPVVATPGALGAYFGWRDALPRTPRSGARVRYQPVPQAVYVRDQALEEAGNTTARVQAYVEMVWARGIRARKLVFYAVRHAELLDRLAKNHVMYLSALGAQAQAPRFELYFRRCSARGGVLSDNTDLLLMPLAVVERICYTLLYVATEDLGSARETKQLLDATFGAEEWCNLPYYDSGAKAVRGVFCGICNRAKPPKGQKKSSELGIGKCGDVFHRFCLDAFLAQYLVEIGPMCPVCREVIQKDNGEVCTGRAQRETHRKDARLVVVPEPQVFRKAWSAVCR